MMDQDAFIKALMGEDELGIVVRAHIHIEAWLNELLSCLGVDMECLQKAQLDYHQRVHLAVALGFKKQHRSPLLAFGNIRNAFAHNIKATLTKERVNNLYNALSPEDKEIAQRVYQSTNAKLNVPGQADTLRGLEPRDQFVILATAVHGMLRAAVVHLGGEA